MTTRLYRHDDVGAPAHSGTGLGQILTILRACLVTGYGTRTAAGWTNPFLDLPNNIGVFQGQSGLGDLFRVNDNVNSEFSEIRGFATMSDVNTGTEEYPIIGDSGITVGFIQSNRDTSTASNDPWFVIASEEFCYFISQGASTERGGFFFGAYEKVSSDSQVPNYIVTGDNATSVNSSSVDRSLFENPEIHQRRNQWNDVERHTRLFMLRTTYSYEQPNPLDGRFYFRRVELSSNDNIPYTFWGFFPELGTMLTGGSEQGFNNFGDLLTIGGDTYITVISNQSVWAFRYDLDVG